MTKRVENVLGKILAIRAKRYLGQSCAGDGVSYASFLGFDEHGGFSRTVKIGNDCAG
jgi:hypothetical protein